MCHGLCLRHWCLAVGVAVVGQRFSRRNDAWAATSGTEQVAVGSIHGVIPPEERPDDSLHSAGEEVIENQKDADKNFEQNPSVDLVLRRVTHERSDERAIRYPHLLSDQQHENKAERGHGQEDLQDVEELAKEVTVYAVDGSAQTRVDHYQDRACKEQISQNRQETAVRLDGGALPIGVAHFSRQLPSRMFSYTICVEGEDSNP